LPHLDGRNSIHRHPKQLFIYQLKNPCVFGFFWTFSNALKRTNNFHETSDEEPAVV